MPSGTRTQKVLWSARRMPDEERSERSTLLIGSPGSRSRRSIGILRLVAGVRLSAGLQCLLPNHAAAVYLGRDRLKPPLFICRRRIKYDRSTDRLRSILGWSRLRWLRHVHRCRRHFGRSQRQVEGAPLMFNRHAVASLIVTSNYEGMAGLVQSRPRATLVRGVVDAEHVARTRGHDSSEFERRIGGRCSFGRRRWR